MTLVYIPCICMYTYMPLKAYTTLHMNNNVIILITLVYSSGI